MRVEHLHIYAVVVGDLYVVAIPVRWLAGWLAGLLTGPGSVGEA